MLSHGIYSVILLIFSNVFMTFAWYGHLKMRQEFSWFAALPLIGVIAFSWAIAFFEYCLQVPANRLGFKDSGGHIILSVWNHCGLFDSYKEFTW